MTMEHTIPTLPLTRFSLGAHNKYHSAAQAIMAQTGAEVLRIEHIFADYTKVVKQESSIVKRRVNFVSTPLLHRTDKDRGSMLAVLSTTIRAHTYSTIQRKRLAAKALMAAYDPYRGIRNHEYARETAEVASLLNVLAHEDNAAHLQTLGLTEEVAELARMNSLFQTEFDKKVAEMSARLNERRTSSLLLRLECDRLYGEIVTVVNAIALLQPTPEITAFITQMSGLVETYRSIVNNSGKRRQEQKQTEETFTTTDTLQDVVSADSATELDGDLDME